MKHAITLLLLVCSSVLTKSGEITTTYEVTLNGQKFLVDAAVTTNVLVEGKELKLSAREKPEKTFSDGNISFAFPAAHAVSKEVQDEIITWTLDGQVNVLTLLKMKDGDASGVGNETVKSLRQQYGAKSKQSSCKVTLGDEKVSGIRITAVLFGETITQEIYELKIGKNGYILMIQDTGTTESDESRKVKALLKDTFKRAPVSEVKPPK